MPTVRKMELQQKMQQMMHFAALIHTLGVLSGCEVNSINLQAGSFGKNF